MSRWLSVLLTLAAAAVVLVAALAVRGPRPHADEPAAGDRQEAPSAIVEVSQAHRVSRRDTLAAFGTIEFSPEESQVVDVAAERIVTRVYVAAGQTVHRGDPLVAAQATPDARLELERGRIDVTFAKQDAARIRDLRARQLATNAQVQVADAQLAKAQAVLDSVVKRWAGAVEVTLSAPMDGVVEAVNVRQGDVVAPHTPLLRLAKQDRLQVRLGVEPEDLPEVRVGQTVVVTPVQGPAAPTMGVTTRIYRQIDPQQRLAQVVVPLPAGPTLLPGSVVRGEIVVRERRNVLVVPRSAILYEGPRAYVFLVAQGHASRHWVEVGADDGRDVEIRQGVAPGEGVVTLGNYELRDGMAVRIQHSGG